MKMTDNVEKVLFAIVVIIALVGLLYWLFQHVDFIG